MLALGVGSALLRSNRQRPDPARPEKPFLMVSPDDLNVGPTAPPIEGSRIDGRRWTDATRHVPHPRLETSARLAAHLSRSASLPRGSTLRERVRRKRGP